MVKRYQHEQGLLLSFEADEGNVTVAEDVVNRGSGSQTTTFTWVSQIRRGNFMEISADWEVQIVSGGTTTILGIADSEPRWHGGKNIPWTVSGATTDLRSLTVETFGTFTREVLIATGGTTAAVGGGIIPDSSVANEWEGIAASLGNKSYVLVAAAADANAVVLYNFYGAFA